MREEIKLLIEDTTKTLKKLYPETAGHCSVASLWGLGLHETTLVSGDLYDEARIYYGNLWNYCGD